MKLENFELVSYAAEQLTRINNSISRCEDVLIEKRERDDDDNESFWGNLSDHSDGSGHRIDLSGCHVYLDVIEATKDVLVKKKKEVEDHLNSLGVEL